MKKKRKYPPSRRRAKKFMKNAVKKGIDISWATTWVGLMLECHGLTQKLEMMARKFREGSLTDIVELTPHEWRYLKSLDVRKGEALEHWEGKKLPSDFKLLTNKHDGKYYIGILSRHLAVT